MSDYQLEDYFVGAVARGTTGGMRAALVVKELREIPEIKHISTELRQQLFRSDCARW
ncbi:MAG TPA: hypothetical protein VFR19_11090 [Hyphomicrobiaceae bacterium]|nr:hypothetical protein [Hyphomicrobiaceae bacterium]